MMMQLQAWDYMPLNMGLALLLLAFLFLGYAFIDNKNPWRLNIVSAGIASILFFYLGFLLNDGLIKQDVGGSLSAVQPPYFGIVLWFLGSMAALIVGLWLMDTMIQAANLRKQKKKLL